MTFGTQKRITLGTLPSLGLVDARAKANNIIEHGKAGRDPRSYRRAEAALRHDNTFTKVRERFVNVVKPNLKSWKNFEQSLLLHVEPRWGSRPIQDIRRADVHALLDDLVEEDKIQTAIAIRKRLSRLFNWAVDREIIKDSPVGGLKRDDLKKNHEAGRALTDAELRKVWRATVSLGYPYGPLYQLLILTGQRRSEWADAKRSEVDGPERWLEVPKGRHKSKRDHVVPLSDAAWALFDTLPVWKGNDYHLFSSSYGERSVSDFSNAKERLNKLLTKVAPFRVHDFRVTCETRLAKLGFNQEVRDAVLGHAKQGLQRIYNKHSYLDEKRAALDAYAKHVMAVVA
ncbi:MAG: site-specific integrase [Bradyrhizobium sp.]|nr:site-specific integrase [Bradyrhizobium sp.]